jgi:hypothetical protein
MIDLCYCTLRGNASPQTKAYIILTSKIRIGVKSPLKKKALYTGGDRFMLLHTQRGNASPQTKAFMQKIENYAIAYIHGVIVFSCTRFWLRNSFL